MGIDSSVRVRRRVVVFVGRGDVVGEVCLRGTEAWSLVGMLGMGCGDDDDSGRWVVFRSGNAQCTDYIAGCRAVSIEVFQVDVDKQIAHVSGWEERSSTGSLAGCMLSRTSDGSAASCMMATLLRAQSRGR